MSTLNYKKMLPEFLRHTPKRKAHFNCQKYPDYLSPVMTESFPHYFLYNICHKCDYAYEKIPLYDKCHL